MFIQEMSTTECLSTLARIRVGRLACAHKNHPYIVPIYFVYEDPYLYGFTTLGQKVEWMRSNPQVCVELDEIVNGTQWMSIVIFGRYQELPENRENGERWDQRLIPLQAKPPYFPKHGQERRHAHDLLQQYAEWWEPGSASSTLRNPKQRLEPVFYRIRIDKITGRRATPNPGKPVTSRKPSCAGESHAWLSRVFNALFQARWRAMKRNK